MTVSINIMRCFPLYQCSRFGMLAFIAKVLLVARILGFAGTKMEVFVDKDQLLSCMSRRCDKLATFNTAYVVAI